MKNCVVRLQWTELQCLVTLKREYEKDKRIQKQLNTDV